MPVFRRLPRTARASRGFTLIEIMVVVVIIAILGSLVVPSMMSRIDDARIVKATGMLGCEATGQDPLLYLVRVIKSGINPFDSKCVFGI